jgi:ABC-type uncharacterized transport system permease subunit
MHTYIIFLEEIQILVRGQFFCKKVVFSGGKNISSRIKALCLSRDVLQIGIYSLCYATSSTSSLWSIESKTCTYMLKAHLLIIHPPLFYYNSICKLFWLFQVHTLRIAKTTYDFVKCGEY